MLIRILHLLKRAKLWLKVVVLGWGQDEWVVKIAEHVHPFSFLTGQHAGGRMYRHNSIYVKQMDWKGSKVPFGSPSCCTHDKELFDLLLVSTCRCEFLLAIQQLACLSMFWGFVYFVCIIAVDVRTTRCTQMKLRRFTSLCSARQNPFFVLYIFVCMKNIYYIILPKKKFL